jgi:hypothetical protein
MEPTNQKIYDKLLELQSLLMKEKNEADMIMQDEEQIKEMVKEKDKKFNDVGEWKQYIWQNCPHRKQDLVSKTRIGFLCGITKGHCDFLNCPENEK